ncbi:MAG: hypothetical protein QT02_C0006G0007 [archaeon GW2011_AR9]|nr:MAG: hypothetical protein QT02_C0006G0007 [archaeon GW2011_AR9]MBS3120476.1 hypothetical protein [Candidatus Woesearchaeota archaeon]HIG92648.1 hypothetical protein [Candidatus Woesearchaeota archaeon]HIH12287.1 hypothetical protein [Candidatus Woesearchaeota archaeon]
MQTPQQLAEWEAWRRRQKMPEQNLGETLELIVKKAGITSRGGVFEFPLKVMKDIDTVREYCERYGWKCAYEPYHVSPTFGDYSLTMHLFRLEPKR